MLAIRAARLFDGVGPGLLPSPVVLVDGGRVVAVRSGGEPPPGADVVDLGGATLLPGLVDGHVHLAFDASADVVARVRTAGDDDLYAGMRAAAAAALAAGVTTVRDLGDRGYLAVRLRDELARDPAAGPRVLASGPPITTPGGHCWYLGGTAGGPDGIRAAVRDRVARGVDVIKVMATGGELTPGSAPYRVQYSEEELRAASDEAHRHGVPVTAHAHAPPGIARAVAAGFDAVEHCSFTTEHGVRVDNRVLDAMARAGVVASLTLGEIPGGPPPAPRLAALVDGWIAASLAMRAAGVRVVCASDSGYQPASPHGVFPYSVAQLVANGFPPLEALRAATSVAARACGIGERAGRIAPGYDADLVAVAGDPLADVAALREVTAVFRAGIAVRAPAAPV